METKKIILLATEADTTNMLYHKLNDAFGVAHVVVEQKISNVETIKRRIRKQGFIDVAGQVLLKLTVEPLLKFSSSSRIQQIIRQYQLNITNIPAEKITEVDSINSDETIQLLHQLDPDLIIVHGTRILSKNLLESVTCKIMNIHAGITPKYRGVHGGYWALAENDPLNCGVTVHFVDGGIDTGEIIAQDNISPSKDDNFYTYPYLQLAKGIELLLRGIKDHFEGKLITKKAVGESVLRHQPTLWQYLALRVTKKLK
jgi:folate-dependent phosphoribosylglycinamide formyltransferase PurN